MRYVVAAPLVAPALWHATHAAPTYAPCARSEWAVNHHRDSLASHIGHTDMLAYFAVAENESVGRVRYAMLERMVQPCGPPPAKPAQ